MYVVMPLYNAELKKKTVFGMKDSQFQAQFVEKIVVEKLVNMQS